MTEFKFQERMPRLGGLQDEGTSIFDDRPAKAFGKDARQDGLLLCHNPFCPKIKPDAYRSWFEGWASLAN